MATNNRPSPESPPSRTGSGLGPGVRLEIRSGASRPAVYELANQAFLIGSVPGCDLRLAGADLPPVICLVTRHPAGAEIRRLVPTHPVLVNGRAVTSSPLTDGDQIALGALKLVVQIDSGAAQEQQDRQALLEEDQRRRDELDALATELEARRQQLDQQTQELEADRIIWYRRLEEMEQERQAEQASAPPSNPKSANVQQRELEVERAELHRQQQEFATLRQQFTEIRQQLYDRYRKRRDRLAGLREAVDRAARKVQENKRLIDAELQGTLARKQEDEARKADLEAQAAALEEGRRLFGEQTQGLANQQKELAKLQAECQLREHSLVREREALEKKQVQHHADLVRLDRLEAMLEQRQQQLQQRALEVDQRFEQIQRTSRELEEHATELDQWNNKLRREAEQLTRQKTEQELVSAKLAQRTADLEGQQVMLTGLRTRLERMREEVRREQQQVADRQADLHEAETAAQTKLQEIQQKQAELDADRQLQEQERRQFEQRQIALEAAVNQLRQVQDGMDLKEQEINERARVLDERTVHHREEMQRLQAQAAEFAAIQERLEADRQAVRESQAKLVQAEQTRETLQEQLRRRADELATKQRTLTEQTQQVSEEQSALAAARAALEEERRQTAQRLDGLQKDLDDRARELDRLAGQLVQREEQLHHQVQRLKEVGRTLGAGRKALYTERKQWQAVQQQANTEAAQTKAELESHRGELLKLQEHLPELELRAQGALERLAHAREQLREHLTELHTYARQSQEDIEALRGQLQTEAEQVRQQRLALQRARDEHRLGVAAFHQQLIEWQGQVADMKRTLAHDETRLERRQAKVEEQARQIDAGSLRLAQQAEQLEQQERVVSERREEMERHLDDMREWYRRKLREMSATRSPGLPTRAQFGTLPDNRNILSMADELDPGDRKLGDLLRNLNLVDAETLTSLLAEARQQHRSLRQALLAGGYLTLYQMALIEAGNVAGLVLGSFRVVDRLAVNAQEAHYRVFDPARGEEAVLRHLAEAALQDRTHPDDYRQRFRQAAQIHHPNVAATYDVLEIAERPAVLQEWLTGLPGSEWPGLVAVPGVWHRLLHEASLGLRASHEAGLVHGHIRPESLLLAGTGVVKLCGVGEPPWLVSQAAREGNAESIANDLLDLGRIAAGWAQLALGRKASKARALPEPLHSILTRLTVEDASQNYPDTGALLADLDRATGKLSTSTEAWEQLVKHVLEQIGEYPPLRKSA